MTKGNEMRLLEAKRSDLVSVYELKNMELSKLKALGYIENSDQIHKMKNASQFVFIRGNTDIAKR